MNLYDERKRKKCKFCGADMQYMLATCPNCNQDQDKGLNIIGGILGIIIIVIIYLKTST